MISAAVVNRYAHALADVVTAPTSTIPPADAVAQLHKFWESAGVAHELQIVLASPAVPRARKRSVIRHIAGSLQLHPIIVNFLLVLSDHNRWDALEEVINQLEAVIEDHLGFERVEVRSAYELSDTQREELSRELTRVAGRKIRMRSSVDPELIGGVTAQVGSVVYDGSVRGQLAKMRQTLGAS
jgi:F-type H+-transporting ATPase subunit delta